MSARLATPSPSRVSLVVVVAAMVVLLAAVLAYEAHHAAQAQRRTAERALREYAGLAASAFRDRYRDGWRADARRALGAATTGLATSPFDPLVSLAVLRQAADGVLACDPAADAAPRRFVRVDLRTGAAEVEPADLATAEREALVRAAQEATQRLPAPEEPYRLVRIAGRPGFLLVGVRFVRLGAPIGVYGFTVCPGALGRRMAERVLDGAPLLPASIAAGADNRAVVAVSLREGDTVLAAWGDEDRSPWTARTTLDDVGFTASVALRRAAVGSVAVGSLEPSRVPLLVGLLALTAVLGAVALVQLRREHELAQMRADFTSSVSHELRTPLTQILLYGETLQLGRARSEGDRRAAAETIVSEARRLMRMVDNVLAFGRLQRSAPAPVLAPVHLQGVVQEAVTMLRPLADAAGVAIEVEGDERVHALADAAMVRQVVLNLVDNAVKHAGTRHVRVGIGRSTGMARLEVCDDGAGIPAAERERIWLPYVRLAQAPGTGLGLAVVRELVTSQGGRAWVEDAATGPGACFVVELAMAVAPAPLAVAGRAS